MLGKLLKNEFAKTWKISVLGFACSVVMSILVTVLFTIEDSMTSGVKFDSQSIVVYEAILRTIAIVGVVSILVVPVALFIYYCIHFYKTMYSTQGYLTHTLPVSPLASFNVKLLVSSIWMIAWVVLMAITLLAIAIVCSGARLSELFGPEVRAAISEAINEVNVELGAVLGASFGDLVWIFISSILIGIVSGFVFIFTALTIGQLSNTHKIGVSIGVGVAINFAQKIISGIVTVVLTAKTFITQLSPEKGYNEAYIDFSGFFNSTLWLSFGLAIGICAIEYVIDILIIRKHINLE